MLFAAQYFILRLMPKIALKSINILYLFLKQILQIKLLR